MNTNSAVSLHKLRLRIPVVITVLLQLDRSNSVTLRRHHATVIDEQIKAFIIFALVYCTFLTVALNASVAFGDATHVCDSLRLPTRTSY